MGAWGPDTYWGAVVFLFTCITTYGNFDHLVLSALDMECIGSYVDLAVVYTLYTISLLHKYTITQINLSIPYCIPINPSFQW